MYKQINSTLVLDTMYVSVQEFFFIKDKRSCVMKGKFILRGNIMKNKGYTGIDYFRCIAALLVIAIHTSPLASFNETADFLLTRGIARIAVPFFFMTSGFFLLSANTYRPDKLISLIKKTTLIYGIAILLYIPINIYNGYFQMDHLLLNMIKDILFDGTLYHLWYLPASLLGAIISWYLVKWFDYPKALTAAGILYLIGLFGNSYYGLIQNIACFNNFYNFIFQITDYTRNGIFFAPVFFILGGMIANEKWHITLNKSIYGFIISLVIMMIEALLLHCFGLQRHDSMYIFLLPCMVFLFHILLSVKGKRLTRLRMMSLIIYIIHPMMIVIIRLFAKLLHLESLMIGNSMIYYVLVCITSIAFSIGIILMDKYKRMKIAAKSIKN